MKRRRLLSLTLALLLVVNLLPMGAMAEDIQPGELAEVPAQKTIDNNYGGVGANAGTITNNGTVDGGSESATVSNNYGTVENNYGCVFDNHSKVTNNQSGGVVKQNLPDGTIETNNGTVGKKDNNGNIVSDTGNFGTIETNNGTVYNNQKVGTVETNNGTIEKNSGTVITNNENGTVETNNGFVGDLDEDGFPVIDPDSDAGNFGNIGVNNGKITINGENATVDTNNFVVYENNGDIGTNNDYVETNNGDIGTNNDYVAVNNGNIGTNNDEVGWNYGTVETNTIDGVVYNKTDTNGVTGEVKTNYGTILTPTGEVNDYGGDTYEAQYGVQVQNTDGGAGTKLLQAVESTIVKLADLFKRDGYELVGYEDITPTSANTVQSGDPNTPKLSATDFQANRPSILSLLWSKISSAVAPSANSASSGSDEPEATPVKVAVTPTKVAAEDVKVGTIVQRKGQRFQVIEMDDGSILVATVGKLSKKDIEDMKAFLAKYFTAEQLEMLLGDPELLSDELVAKYFGGSLEHICFRAAKDIFAQ